MQIHIPTPLRSYTNGQAQINVEGATLGEAFADLDRQCPGLRFRINNEQARVREHIKIFVNRAEADDLSCPVGPNDQIQIILAISGG